MSMSKEKQSQTIIFVLVVVIHLYIYHMSYEYNWNIVESGVKHHKSNQIILRINLFKQTSPKDGFVQISFYMFLNRD
jgi:hypothetical protein